jgi:DNA-binding SARP family transcriptional activator
MAGTICAITLFGGAVLHPMNASPQPLRSRKSGSVLARLLLARDGMFSRQHIMDTLWPDLEPEPQRAAFNTEIWRLRQALTSAFGIRQALRTEADLLIIDPELYQNADLVHFKALQSQLSDQTLSLSDRRAAGVRLDTLYRGPFLPSNQEEWVHGMREHLRSQFLDALEKSIALAEQQHDWTNVRALALRLASEDPFLEQAYRALMRAHEALGNRSAALACYDYLKKLLMDELAVLPMPETRLLADSLREVSVGSTPARTAPLITERNIEMIPASLSRIAKELEGLSLALR